MSADWIKVRTDLHSHPKVVRMACAICAHAVRDPCGMTAARCLVIGALHRVWSLFDAHSTDGVLAGYTLGIVDEMVGVPGFAAAMRDVGWLAADDKCLRMLDFDRHNGQSAKRRAEHAAQTRARRACAQDAHTQRTDCAPEKRREEGEKNNGVVREPLAAPDLIVREFGDVPPTRRRDATLDQWLAAWHGRGRASPEFVAAASDFFRARQDAGKPITPASMGALVTACDGFGDRAVIADMRRASAAGWSFLRPKAEDDVATDALQNAQQLPRHQQAALDALARQEQTTPKGGRR